MKHIDWKLQHCLHKPIGWIKEINTEEVRERGARVKYILYVKYCGYFAGFSKKYDDMFEIGDNKMAERLDKEKAEKIKAILETGGYEIVMKSVESDTE